MTCSSCSTYSAALIAFCITTCTPLTHGVEFHGYLRSGIGFGDNGSQQCVNPKYVGRLGNECETYIDLVLSDALYEQKEKQIHVEVGVSYATPQNDNFESFDNEERTIALRQANLRSIGFFDFAPEATFWIGKEYYERYDIHHLDFFYWDVSGPGAGLSGINTGYGKLSFAVFRRDLNDSNGDNVNGNLLDIRLSEMTFGQHRFDVGINIFFLNLTESQDNSNEADATSTLLTAQWVSRFDLGTNKFIVQYGTEGYGLPLTNAGDGGSVFAPGFNNNGLRLINWGLLTFKPDFHLAYAVIYAKSENNVAETDDDFAHVSTRPTFLWSDTLRTYLEWGLYTANRGGNKEAQQKLTLAQAWSTGHSFWARPELRLFISYITDSENANQFRGDDATLSIGLQAESWW